jgi:hypothetical protein
MTRVPPSEIFTRRVCLAWDGMDDVIVRRDVTYGPPDHRLRMDVYYPPDQTADGRWPGVIIVAGYPGAAEPRPATLAFKETGWTVSMCRLIALSGMAAIAYTHRDPVADLQTLFEHIHESARSLRIDAARLGVIAVSGNVPTALTTTMQQATRTPACAVFGYGCLLDLDESTHVADAARQFGFANPNAGRSIADLRRDVPLLIIRAGRDQFSGDECLHRQLRRSGAWPESPDHPREPRRRSARLRSLRRQPNVARHRAPHAAVPPAAPDGRRPCGARGPR